MAEDIRHFTVTIPAGTPKLTPATVKIAMPPRTVHRIDWRVPTGSMGTFGWQVAMDGAQMFPTGGDLYVVAHGQSGYWDVANTADSGAWQVIGYNTGVNPHSVYLVFHTDVPARPAVLTPLIPAYELSPAPDLSKAGPPVKRRP